MPVARRYMASFTLLTHFNVLLFYDRAKKHNMNLPSEPLLSGQYSNVNYMHLFL